MPARDKLVVITRKTALEELVERFNTRDQARFYIEHMGGSFQAYQDAHDAYHAAIGLLREAMPRGVRTQWIERAFLPTFTFGESDVVVVLGQDGLVVNTAKYLDGQPVVALNPDPLRIDGVLLPFDVHDASRAISLALGDEPAWSQVTMAQAELNDGQRLLAVNDLFIGARTHVSARYRLCYKGREEDQSSSGLIVSTGAGSTGWYRSILTGAAGIVQDFYDEPRVSAVRDRYSFDWETRRLVFSVREPFISRTSTADIVHGTITPSRPLTIISHMPQNGVIFSDGVEEDRLDFNSGAIARIVLADRTLRLVVPPRASPEPRRWGRTDQE
jgi:NAD kinase